MQPTVENVLKELPAYLSQFTRILTAPKQLLHQHLQAEDSAVLFEKAIAFFMLSFIIALVLAVVFPEVTNPVSLSADAASMTTHAMAAIRLLFELLGLGAIAYLSARLVGVHTGFMRFFGLMSAAVGVVLVLQVFASALTNISMADPVTAKSWIQLEKISQTMKANVAQQLCMTDPDTGEIKPDPAMQTTQTRIKAQSQSLYLKASQRPLFKLAAALQFVVTLVILIWLARVWWLYLQYHRLSLAKGWLATVLLLVFGGAGWMLLGLVDAGTTMMGLYRNCA
ncbi:hypothetical protein [Methylophilus aquaticus]|uniref:Uncharacterized protein n=1 Tax=Methylophilus aquaticus TaxID=1971610 RepID=A0ABT9JP40_9PROT|nr:hypothetical protein [Methylophilus aquaticus]MDP8566343.1 hypothetical protein [Methylophilus aquaticus]